MKKEISELTNRQRSELKALEKLPDSQIDTNDIPETLDWTGARRGLFYRPVKKQITIRLDVDLISWFKDHAKEGRGYQTDINRALRRHIERRELYSRSYKLKFSQRPQTESGRSKPSKALPLNAPSSFRPFRHRSKLSNRIRVFTLAPKRQLQTFRFLTAPVSEDSGRTVQQLHKTKTEPQTNLKLPK